MDSIKKDIMRIVRHSGNSTAVSTAATTTTSTRGANSHHGVTSPRTAERTNTGPSDTLSPHEGHSIGQTLPYAPPPPQPLLSPTQGKITLNMIINTYLIIYLYIYCN